VRDHTTDQLTPEGDEYIPRETDDAGDKKVMPTGHLLGGREYRCRTFHVPNRGDKLFMLATECARVLGYRDSYLLFNKNRSLYKIIATQAEKDDLIQQELLPYSYRSRQIAIVTAKSKGLQRMIRLERKDLAPRNKEPLLRVSKLPSNSNSNSSNSSSSNNKLPNSNRPLNNRLNKDTLQSLHCIRTIPCSLNSNRSPKWSNRVSVVLLQLV
jgi:hypothetical protein